MTTSPRKPLNLTATAERMPSAHRQRILPQDDSTAFEIEVVNVTGQGHRSPGLCDEVCVIMSGYGALHCGADMLQCTAGDVLFIPSGAPHRFERLDGDFRLWRILPGSPGRPG